MKLKPKITLLDHFTNLTDPRIDRSKEHKLIDIVAIAQRAVAEPIAICGMLCGADNWVAMKQYGNSKKKCLSSNEIFHPISAKREDSTVLANHKNILSVKIFCNTTCNKVVRNLTTLLVLSHLL